MKKQLYLLPLLISLTTLSCGTKRAIPNTVTFELSDISVTNRHSDLQKTLLEQSKPSDYIRDHLSDFNQVGGDKPLSYVLDIQETNDTGDVADYYEVEYSDSSEFTPSYKVSGKELYNLKSGSYFYRVHSYHGGKDFVSETKNVNVTVSSPRNVYVEGVVNARDMGGWNIGEGRTFKQGLIYRTAQFNKTNYSGSIDSQPTEEGKKTLINELGIKTDVDLRLTRGGENGGIYKSPIGDSVTLVKCPMYYLNRNIFTNEDNKQSIQLFFSTLADINNYPLAFHCVRGTDRTGALAYVLGALVGMNEEDLMMDYLFSNLAPIKSPIYEETISGEDFYIQGIKNSGSGSLSERAKNYLMTTCEIPEETLNTIIDILVD